jgi:hypothetical protein
MILISRCGWLRLITAQKRTPNPGVDILIHGNNDFGHPASAAKTKQDVPNPAFGRLPSLSVTKTNDTEMFGAATVMKCYILDIGNPMGLQQADTWPSQLTARITLDSW